MLIPIRIDMDPVDPLIGTAPFIFGVAIDLVPRPKSSVKSEALASMMAFYISAQALAHIQPEISNIFLLGFGMFGRR